MCWVSNWNSWNGSHGAAAFLASLGASALLVQEIRTAHQEDLGSETYVVGAVADLNRHLATPLTYGEARAQNQKSLSAQIDEEAATRLKQSAVETRDTARLNCVARPDAGDWLPKGTWWPSPRFWRSACADVTRLGLKYQNRDRCDQEGLSYIPIAVDTFGGWHPTSLDALSKLGRQVATRWGGRKTRSCDSSAKGWAFSWPETIWQW